MIETAAATPPDENTDYPNLADRVQSTFIDLIFIVMLMFVCASLLDRFDEAPAWVRIVLFIGLWAVYEPLCTSLGFTLGNLVKGIRVRNFADTTKRINFLQAFFRYVIKFLLGWVSFVTIHSNPQKKSYP